MTNRRYRRLSFISSGEIRGDCKHRHVLLSGADRCLRRDQSGCHRQGGYSDRRIMAIWGDGPARPLTCDERQIYGRREE